MATHLDAQLRLRDAADQRDTDFRIRMIVRFFIPALATKAGAA